MSFKKKFINIQRGSIFFFFLMFRIWKIMMKRTNSCSNREHLKVSVVAWLETSRPMDFDETKINQSRELGKCGRGVGSRCENCSTIALLWYLLICAKYLWGVLDSQDPSFLLFPHALSVLMLGSLPLEDRTAIIMKWCPGAWDFQYCS